MLQAEQVLQERYQLKQQLGQNVGRQTWLADDLQSISSESVIVKLLPFGGEVQWDDLKLFEREAQVLKQLNHPRIPQYRDYFSIDDRLLWFGLVHHYIPGVSLKELLNQGKRFSEQQVRQIAIDVLEILIYLHGLNPPVLHRDIKPSNLIWGEDQQVYLVDFGAVQDRAAQEGATFTVVGTYGYAPMEQFGGRAVPASDLYALGATLIHLLTGMAPADLPQDDLRIQFSDKVNLSPHFVSWIEKLTEPSLKRRFSTAKAALSALQSNSIEHPANSRRPSSSSGGRMIPPYGTRVEVDKSPERLHILIPERRGKGNAGLLQLGGYLTLFMAGILWLTLKVGTPVISFPFLFFLVVLAIRAIRFYYQRTLVAFDRNSNRFELEWRWFGHSVSRYKGAISQLSYVCCSRSKKSSEVMLTGVSSTSYSFGQGLTEYECAWLAQEIQTWLNFK
ncbi:serine/threonine protein kinase [Microcoleus sp. FACHB-53]|nr:serine/threonine protein kinase [Microcoleus sp. FACHB-53]MBD2130603.1 serine/threonine protein kinase [Microcoleus sp. FACHB-1]